MLVEFDAPSYVVDALNQLGRTEDLSFSPDNKRLAIVGYLLDKILILDIKLVRKADGAKVVISDYFEICSTSFKNPHGVAWFDSETIVVANRFGGAIVLALPARLKKAKRNQFWLSPLKVLPPLNHMEGVTADCLLVNHISNNLCEVLLCSNNGNHVSTHLINRADNFSLEASGVLLGSKINVPDGIALSHGKEWLALSNHDDSTVFVYKNHRSLSPDSAPDAILHGVNFPHGIKFVEDSHFLFVSDAGAPFVYGYYSESGKWNGDYQPVSKYRVMSGEAFKRGHVNPQEGGVKGVDFFKDTCIMATTCQEQRLAFFDLSSTVKDVAYVAHNKKTKKSSPKLDDYFYRAARSMQANQDRMIESYHHMVSLHRKDFQKIVSSRSWKITQPLRSLNKCVSQLTAVFKTKG